MATRAERRREEKEKRKLHEQLNKQFKGVSQEQIDKFFAERATAEAMMQEGMKKFEDDCYARYEKQFKAKAAAFDSRIAEMEKQMNKSIAAEEDRIRRVYDERMQRPKAELKREVQGDMMAMIHWVLRDHFNFKPEDLHKLTLQMMRLAVSMQMRERLGCITINDIVRQMKEEGYDMQDDLQIVSEMVDAELDRLDKPYAPAGTIFNTWSPEEDERMTRLIQSGRDYDIISVILNRTVKACQSRVRKLYGTQVLERVRKVVA